MMHKFLNWLFSAHILKTVTLWMSILLLLFAMECADQGDCRGAILRVILAACFFVMAMSIESPYVYTDYCDYVEEEKDCESCSMADSCEVYAKDQEHSRFEDACEVTTEDNNRQETKEEGETHVLS